jgi:hypothetical protein
VVQKNGEPALGSFLAILPQTGRRRTDGAGLAIDDLTFRAYGLDK